MLREGYAVASQRGDMMPRKAIAELLAGLGERPPEAELAQPAAPAGGFVCARTGRPGTKMSRPPFRSPVGQWIADHISEETFEDWVRQGTKVINELRLDLSRDDHAAIYDEHMHEFLGIDAEILGRLTPR